MEQHEMNGTAPGQPTAAPPPPVALRRFRSHKVVEAAKIVHVEEDGPALILDPGKGRDQFVHRVTVEWMAKHAGLKYASLVGGYLVRYADGFESWSPATAFEDGYTELAEGASRMTASETCSAEDRLAPGPSVRRTIETHKVNPANDRLVIEVLDDPGSGGANHLYGIKGFNTGSNPSDPFTAKYGEPAIHGTLIFQNGPIAEVGVNGVTHEALLAIVEDRLESFQKGPFACTENGLALKHLREVIRILHGRTKRRMEAGTEGTHKGT